MSEDLDSFFAKRKVKASKKKAIRLDDVAQALDYSLKFGQDEADIPVSGKRLNDNDFPIPQDEEDSEWIQYNSKPAIPLETVGVFNYNEQVEQEQIAEERQQQAERIKTWQKTEPEPVKEQTPVPTPVPIQEPPKPQVSSAPAPYRPPNARSVGHAVRRPVHKLDIENEELFPSLEKAEQIEKVEKEKEKVRVEEPRQPLKPTPKAPQDVRFQNPWGRKETTPEVIPESKPVVEEPPKPAEPRPNVYQVPAGRTGPVVERVHDSSQQSGNTPYLPRFMRGDDADQELDRSRPTPQTGGRGTGMFNAKGEEILLSEKPAPTTTQASWRRDPEPDQHTQQQNVRAPNPEITNWRSAQPDHHHQQQTRPHQPPRNLQPEVTNWRNDSNRPAAPPRRDNQFDHGRPRTERPRTDHVNERSEGGNWRSGPQHQLQQEQRIEHVDNEPNLPNEPVSNEGPLEEGEDWHVAAGRQRRIGGGPQPSQSAPRRNPPSGKPAYVPPNRR